MTLTDTTQGIQGGRRLALVDDSEVLRIELLIQPEQTSITPGEVEFEVAMRPDRHPHDVIPALEFLADLQDCDGLRLDIPGAPAAPIRLTETTTASIVAPVRAYLVQLTALQRVQDATGNTFGVPPLAAADQDTLYFADQLLTYGHVEWHWPGTAMRLPIDQIKAALATAPLIPRLNLTGRGGNTITIAGHKVTLPSTVTMEVTNAIVTNPAELHRLINQRHRPPTAELRLGAETNTQVIFRLDTN